MSLSWSVQAANNNIFTQSWKAPNHGAGRLCISSGLASWFADSYLLSVSSQGRRGERVFWDLL